jgi:hypothetical protein
MVAFSFNDEYLFIFENDEATGNHLISETPFQHSVRLKRGKIS